jgi:quercetin dioxygenase-like cupin family protein
MSTTDDHSHPSGAVQQAPGLWRTKLQQHDLSVPRRVVVQQRVDIGPEAPRIKHAHPGEEIIYILAGSLEYQIEGQPTRTCNAGETLTVPAGAATSPHGKSLSSLPKSFAAFRSRRLLTAS